MEVEENTLEAVKEMGVDLTVGHVQDMAQIAAYGVMSTPGFVLDEKVAVRDPFYINRKENVDFINLVFKKGGSEE